MLLYLCKQTNKQMKKEITSNALPLIIAVTFYSVIYLINYLNF